MDLGRILFFGGLFLVVVGAIVLRFPNLLSWFGKLPGDFRIEGDRISLFIPLTSMILVSVIMSIGISLMAKLLSWR